MKFYHCFAHNIAYCHCQYGNTLVFPVRCLVTSFCATFTRTFWITLTYVKLQLTLLDDQTFGRSCLARTISIVVYNDVLMFMTMFHCQTCSSEYIACTWTKKLIAWYCSCFFSFLYVVTVLNIDDFLMNIQQTCNVSDQCQISKVRAN